MAPVIIAIHGLRNKPPRYLLANWWKKSIAEGFKIINLPVPRFRLEMAYWSHYMHPRTQDPSESDQDSPRYLWEPYIEGEMFGPRDPRAFRKQISNSVHQQLLELVAGKSGFMNIDAVSNMILRRMFVELDTYYHKKLRDEHGRMVPARELIREELARLLRAYRAHTIMVLAHSMGCIVAYDVMLHVVPDIPVHTLVTMGCPLGFPVILRKITQELNLGATDPGTKLPTPPGLMRRWLNFSDLDDVTCLNYNLRNHYAENSHGVRPFDQIVYNNYEHDGVANPHKSYGYLRCAELTQAFNTFLCIENATLWQRVKWIFSRPKM
ncbi:MAG: hypothetical protein GF418_04740 [Chitinivibrionales bacterium]|nr:hypothetical protein [Chitinivibrionales bacterium]